MEELQIRFYGNGVSPSTVAFDELSTMVTAFENAVRGLIEKTDPEQEKTSFFLTTIEDKSLSLKLRPNYAAMVTAAVISIGDAISKEDYEGLPPKTITNLEQFFSFAQRRNCDGEIGGFDSNGFRKIASITPTTRVLKSENTLKGDTVIFGFVQRAGDADPKITVRLPDDTSISCEASVDLVQSIKIYDWFSFKGEAVWDANTNVVKSFHIKEVTQNKNDSVVDAFRKLSLKFGHIFDNENPDSYVDKMRSN